MSGDRLALGTLSADLQRSPTKMTFYVLFFIHLGSRRVWFAGGTPQPKRLDDPTGRNFSMVLGDWNLPCRYLVHDRAPSFTALDGVATTDQLRVLKPPPHAPLCNAYAERQVREIRETLDQLMVLGQSHLHRTLRSFQEHRRAHLHHAAAGRKAESGNSDRDTRR